LCELYALRLIIDRFPIGPSRGGDAPSEVDELILRNLDAEWPDCVTFRCGQICRKQAGDTRNGNTRGSRSNKTPAIMVDFSGRRTLPRFQFVSNCAIHASISNNATRGAFAPTLKMFCCWCADGQNPCSNTIIQSVSEQRQLREAMNGNVFGVSALGQKRIFKSVTSDLPGTR